MANENEKYISKVKLDSNDYLINATTVQHHDVVAELDTKINKVSGAVEGNIPVFDNQGELVDGLGTEEIQSIDIVNTYSINIVPEITAAASNLEIPTAKAVKDYTDAQSHLPTMPTIDGNYSLTCSIVDGQPTLAWTVQ